MVCFSTVNRLKIVCFVTIQRIPRSRILTPYKNEMKLIQKLCDEIDDELKGAECYIKMALELKSEEPDVSKTLYNISLQEMEHVKMLHDCVVDIIKEYREENGEPPADMLAVYEYLHKRQIDKSAHVKTLQTMYKE